MSRCADCGRLIVDKTSHFYGTIGPLCAEDFERRRKNEHPSSNWWLGLIMRLFGDK